ncbi:MAG TPA: hypothetical protein VD838_14435 [Anaeromyxobacteraceae bacterium]|nr:hypothetical protein [Anaeromyxobacteraceae bacterium]
MSVGNCEIDSSSLPDDLARSAAADSSIEAAPIADDAAFVVVCTKLRRFYSIGGGMVRDVEKATRYLGAVARMRAGRMTGKRTVGGADVEACSLAHARELAARWYPTRDALLAGDPATPPGMARAMNGGAGTAVAIAPPRARDHEEDEDDDEGDRDDDEGDEGPSDTPPKRDAVEEPALAGYRGPSVPPPPPESYTIERPKPPAVPEETPQRRALRAALMAWEAAKRNAAVARMRAHEADALEAKARAELDIARERAK